MKNAKTFCSKCGCEMVVVADSYDVNTGRPNAANRFDTKTGKPLKEYKCKRALEIEKAEKSGVYGFFKRSPQEYHDYIDTSGNRTDWRLYAVLN